MGRFVIAAFKPKSGKESDLLEVVGKHWGILRDQGLVTDRQRLVMKAQDGTLLEIFEWRSPEAIEKAHSNPAVLALWKEFELACDYVPLSALQESAHPFAEFEPVEV